MSFLRYVLRRAAVAVASVYAVVIATFLLGTLTVRNEIRNALAQAADPRREPPANAADLERIRDSLESLYNLDQPLYERLGRWLVDVTTFDWGTSFETHQPIVTILEARVGTTLEYVVPGVLLAMVLGVLLGLTAALARDGAFDWSARLGGYAVLGVPVFMTLEYLRTLSGLAVPLLGGWVLVLADPGPKTLAAIAVALALFAGQLRFARAASLEQSGRSFVKLLRAKGAGRLDLARHVLRNAAIPIVSLSISELLAVLVLTIYVVEEVLGIRGLAGASLRAARTSDLPLLIWTTMVVVFLGIGLRFLQDVLAGYLDPRLRAE
jgi:peptide/nickel transport system permease protein